MSIVGQLQAQAASGAITRAKAAARVFQVGNLGCVDIYRSHTNAATKRRKLI